MKKITSLINLANAQIKTNELKETLAGKGGGKSGGHRMDSDMNGGLLALLPIRCSVICWCSCGDEEQDPLGNNERSMGRDFVGRFYLQNNLAAGIEEW